MLKSLKITKHFLFAAAVGILLQHIKFVILVAEAETIDARVSANQEQYTTSEAFSEMYNKSNGDYPIEINESNNTIDQLESLALYVAPINEQWRDGSSMGEQVPKEECGIHGDHMHLIYVP